MNMTTQIRENFNKGYFNMAMKLADLPDEYPAWTIKMSDWVAVAVPIDEYIPFSEEFAQMEVRTDQNVEINGVTYNLFMIKCNSMQLRNEFASVCSQFVDPGDNGEQRKNMSENPAYWWTQWKNLLGNTISDRNPYDVLGELLTVEKLYSQGIPVKWGGIDHATHDIEATDFSVEVKSTVKRYQYEVTISSVYQMHPTEGKPLYLSYVRFESSELGRSIDDVAKSLVQKGFDLETLEATLAKAGLKPGKTARNKKYKVIEWKLYPVDERFPSITEASFKGDKLPPHIVRMTYTIDLSGISGKNLL